MRDALRQWICRLAGVFGFSRSDQDLEQELQSHLELAEQDLRRQGLSPEAAAREARLLAGGPTQTMEILRDSRGIPSLSTFWLDARLGLRMLGKHWGLTLIGGLTLAVTMAIGAAIFNFIGVIRGTALPLSEGDRVVIIQPFDRNTQQIRNSGRQDFARWRSELRSVESVSGFRTVQRNLITPGGPPAPVSVAEISAAGFQVPRVAPLLGRFLLPEDEFAAAPPVLVIAYDVWKVKFSANPQVLGQQVQLDGVSHTIVGVMPPGFAFPVNHRYWTALKPNAADRVVVLARLVPGASVDSANAEVQAMGLQEPQPIAGAGQPLQSRVVPYVSGIGGIGGPGLAITPLLPFVLPLLLVPPCANIAILIYARTVARQGEFATRAALGAGRSRIVGQILIEVLLLTGGAAGVALFLASSVGAMVKSLVAFGDQPFWMDFGLSYQTILFAGILALISAMIAGGIPAIRATGRWSLSGIQVLRGGSNPPLGKAWTAVVAAQVAVSVAFVPIVMEMAWHSMRPAIFGPGFGAGEFLTARLAMDRQTASDDTAARFSALRGELTRRLKAETGVTAVTMSETVPFEEPDVLIEVEGAGTGGTIHRKSVSLNHVDGAFFEAYGMPLLTGRQLRASDASPVRGAVLINKSFALRILGADNPLGRRVRVIEANDEPASAMAPVYEIVGVVGDLSAESPTVTMYRPLTSGRDTQSRTAELHQVRLTLHAGPTIQPHLATRLPEIAAELDPAMRVDDLQTLDEIHWRLSIGGLAVSGIAAGLALAWMLFSVAGIYTSMAFTLVQRRREIGIRAALGAPPSRLIAGAFRHVLLPAGAGAALGGLAALVLEYYLAPLLFDFGRGGRPLPLILAGTEASVFLIAAIALSGPFRRALRVDPVEALRES
jgi:predicted permease